MAFKDNFRGDSAYTQIMTKIFNIFWLSILWLFVLYPGDHHRRIYHCSVLCDAEACKR